MLSSNIIPRCFRDKLCETGFKLKYNLGCVGLLDLQENISS